METTAAERVSPLTYYGEIGLEHVDIHARAAWSLDLRRFTGMPDAPDESRLMPPGTFTKSVVSVINDEAIGEVRVWLEGRELRIVGQRTNRGLLELETDAIVAATNDAAYNKLLCDWLFGLRT